MLLESCVTQRLCLPMHAALSTRSCTQLFTRTCSNLCRTAGRCVLHAAHTCRRTHPQPTHAARCSPNSNCTTRESLSHCPHISHMLSFYPLRCAYSCAPYSRVQLCVFNRLCAAGNDKHKRNDCASHACNALSLPLGFSKFTRSSPILSLLAVVIARL